MDGLGPLSGLANEVIKRESANLSHRMQNPSEIHRQYTQTDHQVITFTVLLYRTVLFRTVRLSATLLNDTSTIE